MSRSRTPLATTIAILACASAGGSLDTAAAARPAVAGGVVAARRTRLALARPSPAERRRRRRSTCLASASRRRARRAHTTSTCRSRAVPSGYSHAARLDGSRSAHERSGRHARGEHRRHAPIPSVMPAPAGLSIASVLATPCANTELTPEPGNLAAIDTATLCLVNQERARNGEQPLAPNAQLQQAAQGHSEEMVDDDYFAHVSPSGLTPVGRIQATGYIPNSDKAGYTLGENIAWGTLQLSTPSSIVAAWIASPEHLANILYAPYRDTAVGVVAAVPASLGEGESGAMYSQELGVIVE